MTRDELNNEYFEWIYQLVCNDKYYKRLSYRKLLYFLHDTEFYNIIELDRNRAKDGVDFRYRFGIECGYSREDVKRCLDIRPCSVLEMMVALAFRVEEQIMDDDRYGNRTGQWFWNMIVSLGLGGMSDAHFDWKYATNVMCTFLNRDYEPDGRGGLFTVEDYKRDMRDVEIWTQFMWYLNEVIEGE